MVVPVGIVEIVEILKNIFDLGNKINEQVETFHDNKRSRASLLDHIRRVSAIVMCQQKILKRKTITDRDLYKVLCDAFMALKKTLELGHAEIEACKNKCRLTRFLNASSIAKTLREVGENISKDMGTATLATVLCIYSLMDDKTLADIKKDGNACSDRDTASVSSRMASLSKQKVEDLTHLPAEVTESVQIYCTPTPCASNQNNNRRKANNKTMDYNSSGKVGVEENNVRAEQRVSCDGSAGMSASKKSVAGQGVPTSITNKLHGKVFTETLTATTCEPTSCQIILETGTQLTSFDVNPTKGWIVTTSVAGQCVIWEDHPNKIPKKLMELRLKEACSAKFIVQKEWLAVGTQDGFIYIYSYKSTNLDKVHRLNRGDAKAVNSLAVHPQELNLLSSSDSSNRIIQWPLNVDMWDKKREIHVTGTVGIHGLKYCPSHGDTFVAVTDANKAKIYTTAFSSLEPTTLEASSSADYYPTDSNQHSMVTCQNGSSNCKVKKIWNLKVEVVHTLEVSGRKMNQVACSTKLKILATSTFIENKDKRSSTSVDGIVCLWDASTKRLEKMVRIPGMGRSHYMLFATDMNDLTRLFVMFGTKIAIVEVNSPVANTSERNGGIG